MNLGLGPLLRRLDEVAPEPCVLATVVRTEGSSYRKSGAMMLLSGRQPPVGLVSGGCLEGDLAEHARGVFDSGTSRIVTYDLRRDDETLWGLGIGCGGAISVLLERAAHADGYAGLREVSRFWREDRFCWLLKRVDESRVSGPDRYCVVGDGADPPAPFDDTTMSNAPREHASHLAQDRLLIPVAPPPRLLVCGAGPDAVPLLAYAADSGWRVDAFDHRPAHAQGIEAGDAVSVHCQPVDELTARLADWPVDAAVIMNHHLEHDAAYLRALLNTQARYIGLLGPPARRDEVIARAGVSADGRVFGPAGLDIGADLPQSIAISVLAEAHAVLHGRGGASMATRG